MNQPIDINNQHDVGVILAQVGTPDSTSVKDVRSYLAEFLSDPRVIELPRWQWLPILHGIILRTRPRKSAELYKRVWSKRGSPLLKVSEKQQQLLAKRLAPHYNKVQVELGMRYGNPSMQAAISKIVANNIRTIVLLPFFPQYSAATTGTACDIVYSELLKYRWVPTVRVVEPYYNHPLYLGAIADRINDKLKSFKPDKLLISYHGIPERYVNNGDPYRAMCEATTEGLRPLINMDTIDILESFQSRFGKEPWLQPYTDDTVKELAQQGVKKLAVVCPGFISDCLETLDEIGVEAREEFMEFGGEELQLIPCLNSSTSFIDLMEDLVLHQTSAGHSGARIAV